LSVFSADDDDVGGDDDGEGVPSLLLSPSLLEVLAKRMSGNDDNDNDKDNDEDGPREFQDGSVVIAA